MRMHLVDEAINVASALCFPEALVQIAHPGWLTHPEFGEERTESLLNPLDGL